MGFIHCNLRVLMAENGLNIQRVKEQTTLSRTTISNLYNNYGVGVQYDTMRQLCELLNCGPGDLFKYVDAEVHFEVLKNNKIEIETDVHVTDPIDGDGFEYVSKVKAELLIECEVIYSGESKKIPFNTELLAELDSDNNLSRIPEQKHLNYDIWLKELNLPYYVQDYIQGNWDEFSCNWALEYAEHINLN